MSSLTIFSSESNRYSASDFASCVFPTPVGPKNMNVPIGFPGSFMPARLRCIARTTLSMASSWPMMADWSILRIFTSLMPSLSAIFPEGIPVIFDMTVATSSAVTYPVLPGFFSLTMDPASSIASIALSGRHLSVMYLSDILTHASIAPSVYMTL